MAPEFDSHQNLSSNSSEDLPSGKSENSASPAGNLGMQQRDRFELLSAYLDGEVTAAERRQVQQWLDTDPQMQRLYNRLLNLRGALRTLSVPQEVSAQQTIDDVFAKLDRRPNRLWRWGGVAIAAVFVGGLATVLPGRNLLLPQIAKSPEPLMVALNEPLVNIPKAAVTSPVQPVPAATDRSHDRQSH